MNLIDLPRLKFCNWLMLSAARVNPLRGSKFSLEPRNTLNRCL